MQTDIQGAIVALIANESARTAMVCRSRSVSERLLRAEVPAYNDVITTLLVERAAALDIGARPEDDTMNRPLGEAYAYQVKTICQPHQS